MAFASQMLDRLMDLAAYVLDQPGSSTSPLAPAGSPTSNEIASTIKCMTVTTPAPYCLQHGGSTACLHSGQDDVRIPRKMVQAVLSQGCCPVQLHMLLRRAVQRSDNALIPSETITFGSLGVLGVECLVQIFQLLTFPEHLACRASARAFILWVMPVDCGTCNLWLTALDATRRRLKEEASLAIHIQQQQQTQWRQQLEQQARQHRQRRSQQMVQWMRQISLHQQQLTQQVQENEKQIQCLRQKEQQNEQRIQRLEQRAEAREQCQIQTCILTCRCNLPLADRV